MDDDLRDEFKEIESRLANLEGHVQDHSEFWYKPVMVGMPSRVEQFDKMLLINHDRKYMWKSLVWLFGILTALSAAGVSLSKFFKLF